jgi:hypothetical protein
MTATPGVAGQLGELAEVDLLVALAQAGAAVRLDPA